MTKHDKNIIFLLCLTLFLLVFFTYPTLKPYMINQPYQIAKEPDEPKMYDDLLKKGAIPKSLQHPSKHPPFYETIGKRCEPFGSIMSVVMPFITFGAAIWNWIKKAK